MRGHRGRPRQSFPKIELATFQRRQPEKHYCVTIASGGPPKRGAGSGPSSASTEEDELSLSRESNCSLSGEPIDNPVLHTTSGAEEEMKGGLARIGWFYGQWLAWAAGLKKDDDVANEGLELIAETVAEQAEDSKLAKKSVDDKKKKAEQSFSLLSAPALRDAAVAIVSRGSFMLALFFVALLSAMGFGLPFILVLWFIFEVDDFIGAWHRWLTGRYGPAFNDIDPAFIVGIHAETLGWLNEIVSMLWNRVLRNFVAAEGLAIINAKIPVTLLKLDIGDQVPWVTAIRCHQPLTRTDAINEDALIVDLGVRADLRPDVVATAGNIFFFGLRRFHFSAPLRITLTPVFDEKKVVGDLKVSLMSKPRIDYEFTGLLTFLNTAVVKCPVKAVVWLCSYVLGYPRHLRLSTTGMEPPEHFAAGPPVPAGLLRVKILRGESIDPKVTPYVSLWTSRSRPFSLIHLNDIMEESEHGNDSVTQYYSNFISEFPLKAEDVDGGHIVVEVLNEHLTACLDKQGKPIPQMKLNLKRLSRRGLRKLAMRLDSTSKTKNKRKGGGSRLIMLFQFVPVAGKHSTIHPVPRNPLISQAIFSLFIFEVRSKAMSRPFLSIVVSGGPSSVTSRGSANEICDFWEHFLFPVHDVNTDQVTISLMDSIDGEKQPTGQPVHKKSRIKEVRFENEDHAAVEKEPCKITSSEKVQFLLGRSTVNMEYFTGYKQILQVDCPARSCLHEILLAGKFHYLANTLPSRQKSRSKSK